MLICSSGLAINYSTDWGWAISEVASEDVNINRGIFMKGCPHRDWGCWVIELRARWAAAPRPHPPKDARPAVRPISRQSILAISLDGHTMICQNNNKTQNMIRLSPSQPAIHLIKSWKRRRDGKKGAGSCKKVNKSMHF